MATFEPTSKINSSNLVKRLAWARQAAQALSFIHNCGVIHGDVNASNALLSPKLNARLADLAESSLNGSPLLSFSSERRPATNTQDPHFTYSRYICAWLDHI
jgi:serine/threonine protein kinase